MNRCLNPIDLEKRIFELENNSNSDGTFDVMTLDSSDFEFVSDESVTGDPSFGHYVCNINNATGYTPISASVNYPYANSPLDAYVNTGIEDLEDGDTQIIVYDKFVENGIIVGADFTVNILLYKGV